MRSDALKNKNPLDSNRYTFTIDKIPAVVYQLTDVTIPGLSLGSSPHPNPFNRYAIPGDLSWRELSISYQVDEEMRSWKELYTWMVALGHPQNFEQYRALMQDSTFTHRPTDKNIYSDATLTIHTSAWNPILRIRFTDCWPFSIDNIPLSSQNSDTRYVKASAEFHYTDYIPEFLTS